MNREFLILFVIFLFGFTVIAFITHKFVEWLFGDNDQEKQ